MAFVSRLVTVRLVLHSETLPLWPAWLLAALGAVVFLFGAWFVAPFLFAGAGLWAVHRARTLLEVYPDVLRVGSVRVPVSTLDRRVLELQRGALLSPREAANLVASEFHPAVYAPPGKVDLVVAQRTGQVTVVPTMRREPLLTLLLSLTHR